MTTSDASRTAVPPCLSHRRDDLHVEELDGEAVLYDPQNGTVHRFNATTFFVWSACDGWRTPKDIALGVAEHYSVGADEALKVVRSVIAQLHEKELLQADHADSADAGLAEWKRSALTNTTGQGIATDVALSTPKRAPVAQRADRGLSRRELLGGGVAKAVLAAPVILTFCAARAYAGASNPIHPGSATGPGGCKNIGFSCVVNADCCEGGAKSACQDQGGPTKTCCVQSNQSGCVYDNDCCNTNDVCIAGICQ